MIQFKVKTSEKCQFIDITEEITRQINTQSWHDGLLLIMIPHTTAAVTINESADSSVARDIVSQLNNTIPFKGDYQHLEGNSPAHIKSSLIGCDQLLPVENSSPVLGTWQGIFFCEFDGPRTRKVNLKFISEGK